MPGPGELRSYLVWCFTLVGVLWAALTALVLVNRLLYDWRQRRLQNIAGLRTLSRREVYRIIARPSTPDSVAKACAAYVMQRWGLDAIIRDATRHTRFTKWRRVSALLVLAHLDHPRAHDMLADALETRDHDLAGAAIVGLMRLGDRRAAVVLIDALRRQLYSASRIATQLERFTVDIRDLLRPLLADSQSHVRYWAASVLASAPYGASLAAEVSMLTADPDSSVRKVAIETLSQFDDPAVFAVVPLRLMDDAPYVRSAAIRALGRLGTLLPGAERREVIQAIASRLGDEAWDVRQSAKEALVSFGPPAWKEVAMHLDATDAFARNGAAEVLQNIGLIDQLVDAAASGQSSDPVVKLVLARAFEAGGAKMVEAAHARWSVS
jgi:HEAT repeat protein